VGQRSVSGDDMLAPLRLGEWVRQARKAARLTQEELAERAGVSVYTISNLERGVPHAPRPDTLRLLIRALNAAPEDTDRLLQSARSMPETSDLGAPRSPIVGSAPRHAALPLPLTPLLGREHETEAISGQLVSPQVRLLSLLGVGGVGKTRLAIECARRIAQTPDMFADGVVYVSLAAVPSLGLVPTAIAAALGVRETSDSPLEAALLAATAYRTLLLVLDNCEHLSGMGPYVAQLLMASPGLKALVTSRAALNIAGEYHFEVCPLALPAEADPLPPEQLARIPSVALFIERAQAVRQGFVLTVDNAIAIAAICRRLDGLPLALELAAPQLALLSPDELLIRLDHRLSALSAGGMDRPARQQTLRATLDWSYDLLDPVAQASLRWLSLCAGGSTLEVAEALCAHACKQTNSPYGLMERSAPAPLDVITRLANHHLLQRQPGERSEADRRLTMLATIEEYAQERLHESTEETLAATYAHARIYLEFVEAAAAGLQGAEQGQWLQRFAHEQDNIRAALRWGLEQQQGLIALRFVAALWVYWSTAGMLSEGRDWLEQALALASSVNAADPSGQRTLAEAYNGAGVLATRQGDFAAAERFHAQALPLRRALGDPVALVSSLNSVGGLLMQQGRLSKAQAVWEESLNYRRQTGDSRSIALGLMNLGVLALNRGEIHAAIAYSEESVPLFQAAGDETMLATALINLAMASLLAGELQAAERYVTSGVALARARERRHQIGLGLIVQSELAHMRDDLGAAEALAREALDLWREIGAQTNVAVVLGLLGTFQCERGNLEAAERLLQQSLALSEQLGDELGLADVWIRRGQVAWLEGNWAQAVSAYRRSLEQSMRMESLAGVPDALEGLAAAWQRQGETERALQFWALAQAIRSHTGSARATYNEAWVTPLQSEIQAQVGALRWETSHATFTLLSIAQLRASVSELALH
jgi:predicted ATPase/transcriptional regulator with XRE-family HTH domain